MVAQLYLVGYTVTGDMGISSGTAPVVVNVEYPDIGPSRGEVMRALLEAIPEPLSRIEMTEVVYSGGLLRPDEWYDPEAKGPIWHVSSDDERDEMFAAHVGKQLEAVATAAYYLNQAGISAVIVPATSSDATA